MLGDDEGDADGSNDGLSDGIADGRTVGKDEEYTVGKYVGFVDGGLVGV